MTIYAMDKTSFHSKRKSEGQTNEGFETKQDVSITINIRTWTSFFFCLNVWLQVEAQAQVHSLSKQVESLQASQERGNTRIQMLKQSIRELEEGKSEF